MKFVGIALLLAGTLAAQTWDNSGNGRLSGSYYFRQVVFTQTDALTLYGSINFNGNGGYTITGSQILDCSQFCSGGNYSSSGTYAVAASGHTMISSQLTANPVVGLVGANGVFVGSTTEAALNDLFIAAPISGQSTGTLNGSYSLAYLSLGGQVPFSALLQVSANGSCGIGSIGVTAYTTNSTFSAPAATGSISNIKCRVSNNAFVITFPNSSSALIAGDEYLYSTPDGSLVFGGSPQDFDFFVGVRTGGPASAFGGSYYEAGMDISSSYYGALNANNGAIVGHQRFQDGSGTAVSYTYSSSYPPASSGNYNDAAVSTQFITGSGGAVRVGLGIGSFLGLSLGVQAPAFSGSGVFLYPNGVVNAASYAPFTAGVARGELIVLTGTNLGPEVLQVASAVPLPTTLGGVQVIVNGIAAPLYYVSATQLSAVIPWAITQSIAQIQVVNNGTPSNTITELVNKTAPGVFTNPANGIGYAAAIHQDGVTKITPSSPAQPGEVISVYLTGLGDVFPAITDGSAGPSTTLSNTTNTINAYIDGAKATVAYEGLAPGLVALYQINLTIPSAATAGDHLLDIQGPDAYTSESLLTIGGGTPAAAVPASEPSRVRPRGRARRAPVRPAY